MTTSSKSSLTGSTRPRQQQGQKPASSMAELMAKMGSKMQPLKKGETVSAVVVSVTLQEIMLQVNNKIDVLVLENDRKLYKQLLVFLHTGDSVDAVVLYPESDEGYPMVSLRSFLEKKQWEKLETLKKSGAKIEVTVLESTKGGLVVGSNIGVNGFLPKSHLAVNQQADALVGQKLQVTVADITKDPKKVIFSQKSQLSAEDFQELANIYKKGTKFSGTISGITSFGMFVAMPYEKKGEGKITVDGLVHISEVSWEKVEELQNMYRVGQVVTAVVIGVDPRSKRIDLSIKRLTKDPFQKILDAFPVDKKVNGKVVEMTDQGLTLDLGEIDGLQVEGLIKKDKIPPTTTYEKGQRVDATVVLVDNKKRKVMLTPVLLEKPLMYR